MSSVLLAATRSTNVGLVLSPSVNIVFDGNSITDDHLATGIDELVAEALGAGRNGASMSLGGGLGVSGQTWDNMRTSIADLSNAWVSGKTNVLVCSETTNSIWNAGRSVNETISDATRYLAAAAALHPWIILLWGTIPRGHADETNYPGDAARNQMMIDVDGYMSSNYLDMGAHAYLNVRAGTPMFDHDGTVATKFSDYQIVWNEAPPSTSGWNSVDLGWTHPKDGVAPSAGTPGTGKRALAASIAAALTDGRLPPTP